MKRRSLGFFDRSTIPVTVEEDPEGRREEERKGSKLQSSNQRSPSFSVADPIGASTTHDGEYSFGFLSWLARDLGASIDYAKSRLKIWFSAPRIFDVLPREAGNLHFSINRNRLSHAENWASRTLPRKPNTFAFY